MKTMYDLMKTVDINWVIELCHKPGARLDLMQEEITLKYNHLTADEAKKIILFIALAEGAVKAVKDLNHPGK